MTLSKKGEQHDHRFITKPPFDSEGCHFGSASDRFDSAEVGLAFHTKPRLLVPASVIDSTVTRWVLRYV